MRAYRLSFDPAERYNGGHRVTYDLRNPTPTVIVEAANFDDLEAIMRERAEAVFADSEHSCLAAYVEVADGRRRPSGFAGFRDRVRLIDRVAEPAQ